MPGERNWHFGPPTRSNGRAKQSRGIPGAGKMLRTQEYAPGGLVLSWEAALTPLSPSHPLYSGGALSDVNGVAHTSVCPSKGTAAHGGKGHAVFPAKKNHQPGADALLLKCASLWHSRMGGLVLLGQHTAAAEQAQPKSHCLRETWTQVFNMKNSNKSFMRVSLSLKNYKENLEIHP